MADKIYRATLEDWINAPALEFTGGSLNKASETMTVEEMLLSQFASIKGELLNNKLQIARLKDYIRARMTDEIKPQELKFASEPETFQAFEFAEPKPLASKVSELQAQIEQLKEYIGMVEDQEETIEPIDIEHLQNKIGISELIKRVGKLEDHTQALIRSLEAINNKAVEIMNLDSEKLWDELKKQAEITKNNWIYIRKTANRLDDLIDQLAAKRSLWSKFKDWMLKKGFWINTDFKD